MSLNRCLRQLERRAADGRRAYDHAAALEYEKASKAHIGRRLRALTQGAPFDEASPERPSFLPPEDPAAARHYKRLIVERLDRLRKAQEQTAQEQTAQEQSAEEEMP